MERPPIGEPGNRTPVPSVDAPTFGKAEGCLPPSLRLSEPRATQSQFGFLSSAAGFLPMFILLKSKGAEGLDLEDTANSVIPQMKKQV